MSFVPKMQNYFGKDSDFSKLSNLYGDAAAFQQSAGIKGDLIRQQAADRAQMRLLAGEYAKDQGQAAGSSAVTNGVISGVGSAVGGAIQGGFSEDGIWNKGTDSSSPFAFDSSSIPSSAYTEGFDIGGTNSLNFDWNQKIDYNPFGN